ncbi:MULTISPECIES: PIN domain-containing protein [Rhodomicrobium]|uniref:PIN domain-containing protein n=1 Tax=Rhodomicrobium TaxID=1068 RepID=UPI001FDAC497|nr:MULTISPECIES: PIN domain-containing protein [Rhodomicrobium]
MDARKKTIASELIQETFFGLSAQVVQEFYTVATRKADFKMPGEKAMEWLENFQEFPCHPIDMGLVKNAAVMASRYGLSYWDGAILAAASALGAPVVYSEDLNHGQTYGDVKVCNPFKDVPKSGFHEDAAAAPGAGSDQRNTSF